MSEGIRGSKNLGLVQAIFVGVNPPLNKRIIWFDDNIGVKIHKAYDFLAAEWRPIGGQGISITGIFTYIGYATSCAGADFALIKTSDHTHFAIITSPTAISIPTALMFAGRWAPFCTGIVPAGNYTYIGYADDCDGTNFDIVPEYDVDCGECKRVDEIALTKRSNTITAVMVGSELVITFTNAVLTQFISLNLLQEGNPLASMTDYFIESVRSNAFAGEVRIQYDPNQPDYKAVNSTTDLSESYNQVINGSKIYVSVASVNPGTTLTGTLTLKIGTAACKAETAEECHKCRELIGFITSDTPITTLTPELFEGKWINLAGCGCGSGTGKDSNLYNQLIYLNDRLNEFMSLKNTSDGAVATQLTTLSTAVTNNYNSLSTAVENAIAQMEETENDLTNDFNDLAQTVSNNYNSLQDAIEAMESTIQAWASSRIATIQTTVDSLLTSMIDLQGRVLKLENKTFDDTLTGAKNGTNLVFTTSFQFLGGTTVVTKNTVELVRGVDYAEKIGNTSIEFAAAPISSDVLTIKYLKTT